MSSSTNKNGAADWPAIISVVTATATCLGCDDATTHRFSELSNGELLAACDGCFTVTILGGDE